MAVLQWLYAVESRREWPAFFANLIALLPKPCCALTDLRPIGKTPLVYRMWCVLRSHPAKLWEQSNMPEWDKCKPGSSALDAALNRSLLAEVAHRLGEHSVAVLWDLEKFFDTISTSDLIEAAMELDFPPLPLYLAMLQHLAPRRLQCQGFVSPAILPLQSILPGCLFSIPFVRLYLRRSFSTVVSSNPAVNHGAYVDDVGQLATGGLGNSLLAITNAAHSFADLTRSLALRISKKSTIVASSRLAARLLARSLEANGVRVNIAQGTRDLGLYYHATQRRRVSQLRSRLNASTRRLTRISTLTRMLKSARKLVPTSAFPQGLWGCGSYWDCPHHIVCLSLSCCRCDRH